MARKAAARADHTLMKGPNGWAFWHVLEGTLAQQDPHAWTGGASEPQPIKNIDDAMAAVGQELEQADQKRVSNKLFPQLAKSIDTHTATVEDCLSLQAWLFLNSPYRYHWYCAGIGTGKSYVLARWMLMRLITNWETVGLVAANTYTQLVQSTLPHLFELLDEAGLEYVVNSKPPKSWRATSKFKGGYKHVISVKIGIGKVAHLLTRTLTGWKRIRGVTIGWAGIDEIADTVVDAWKEINERLRCKKSHQLQIRVVGMPALPGDNWTWEVFNPDDLEARKMFRITFQSSTEAQHLSWRDYLMPLLRTLDPLQALQRVFARIVIDQSGRVYRGYRHGVNNEKKYDYDPTRDLYLTFDFNILSTSPISAAVVQLFDNGHREWDIQVLDEVVMPNADTEAACREFLERKCDGHVFKRHKGGLHIYGDASGGHGQTISEFSIIRQALEPVFKGRLEIPDITDNPDVIDRVAAVNALLCPTIGDARLYIDPKRCPKLIVDLRKLVPDKKKEGQIDKSDKLLSHISDALGYLLAYLFPQHEIRPVRRAIKANYR